MAFRPQEFRAAIADNSSKYLLGIVSQVLINLRYDKLITELSGILKDPGESPILKLKSTRLIMYLLLIGEIEVYDSMKDQLYPVIRNATFFNRTHPISSRGAEFFRNNPYTSVATFEEKIKLKDIGVKYIKFCLQCVYVLSQWLPTEQDQTTKSLFRKSYEALLRDGVEFPNENQFDFFSFERIKQIEEQIRVCQEQAANSKLNIDQDYMLSPKSKKDAEMMNGVEYLQRRLKEKDKVIIELKTKGDYRDVDKQSILEKEREKEREKDQAYIGKISSYEKKIAELNEEVKTIRNLLKQTQADTEELRRNKETIKMLHEKVDRLTIENQELRMQIVSNKNSSVVSFQSSEKIKPISSKHTSTKEKYINLKQLLNIEKEPNECETKPKKALEKQQFFTFAQAKQSFMPYIDTLSREQTIRLKKSILKTKQVLYKSKQMEVGIISTLNNQIQVGLTIIITNLTQKLLRLHQVTFDHTKDVQIEGGAQGEAGKRKLKFGQQFKQELKIVVNNIDTRCLVMIVEYQEEEMPNQKLALVLPISKFKLVSILNFTSHPKDWVQVQRIFTLQKKILSSLQKLKQYFPKCFIQVGQVIKTYNLKCQLLQNIIFISLNMVGQESIRILASFKSHNRCLGEKLLNQIIFILSK